MRHETELLEVIGTRRAAQTEGRKRAAGRHVHAPRAKAEAAGRGPLEPEEILTAHAERREEGGQTAKTSLAAVLKRAQNLLALAHSGHRRTRVMKGVDLWDLPSTVLSGRVTAAWQAREHLTGGIGSPNRMPWRWAGVAE